MINLWSTSYRWTTLTVSQKLEHYVHDIIGGQYGHQGPMNPPALGYLVADLGETLRFGYTPTRCHCERGSENPRKQPTKNSPLTAVLPSREKSESARLIRSGRPPTSVLFRFEQLIMAQRTGWQDSKQYEWHSHDCFVIFVAWNWASLSIQFHWLTFGVYEGIVWLMKGSRQMECMFNQQKDSSSEIEWHHDA